MKKESEVLKEPVNKKHILQWHPAFYAGIQIEFEAEVDKLTFIREYPLATKPILIDVLIIKKNTEDKIKKNIGRIFRKHNIVEYKSPRDYLSIDDFYKVYAYTCYYIFSSKRVNSIPADEVTITFVSFRYPNKMLELLKKDRELEVKKVDKGIYYLLGDSFPIQLIVTKKLSRENNFWLSCLTNDLKGRSIIDKISSEHRKHRRNELYKSVMNIIVRANKEQFEEGKSMCEAILELFQDEVDIATKKAREEGINEGIEQGKEQGIEQGMTLAIITVLRKKGDVPMSLKEKINKEKNVDVMESWLELTTEVSSVEEFEEKMY